MCTGILVSLLRCAQCDTHCDSCVWGKQTRPSFPESNRSPPGILHIIHADTVGELPSSGTGGERHFLSLVDEYSSYCQIIPIHQKSAITQELINVIAGWERQCNANVNVVWTDRGTEFLNKKLHGYCAENGIHTEMSEAYTPQGNGTVERMNRTIKEKARTLLLGVNADDCLWNEAVKTAAHLHNILSTCEKSKTPYEAFTERVPDKSDLRRWGVSRLCEKGKTSN